MSDIKISLDSSGPKGEISVVRVDGVIDTMTSTDLEKVMNSLMERRRYKIIIDLGGVDYISSAGWGIFISNIREIRQHEGDIKLARMIPNVYEIFELLEFDSILKAFDSVEKAKSDFAGLRPDSGNPALDNRGGDIQESSSVQAAAARAATTMATEKTADVTAKDSQKNSDKTQQSVQDIILEMISKDPFLTISEIKKEVARKYPALKVGWWQIWNILRGESLLSRKSRFRRAKLKGGVG